ncbi:MAG: tRNA uracil 4-sulfurtransferase ThiI [Candidatus Aenigmatarchaeota archaeon]
MYTYILVHYGEIGIKGKNRIYFEKKLIENIKKALYGLQYEFINRLYGRIIIKLTKNSNIKMIKKRLKNVFGISYFSFAIDAKISINDMKKKALILLKTNKRKTFRITTRRSYKKFPYESRKVNEIVGKYIVDCTGMKVNLSKPDIEIFIEITERNAFIYYEKVKGLGGLPIGVSGKVVSLISGGIDSPVASFMMMKRGCEVVFVHFHNYTGLSYEVKNKIIKLVEILNRYQFNSKLYLVPFKEIQLEIIKYVPAKYRMIIYRIIMLRIAENILEKEKAKAFVTGDNIAQVASQTLENLNIIYNSTKYLVFSPLIGFDKNEIILMSKKIGTYNTSIKPYNDCCSFFVSKHPTTKGNINIIRNLEKMLKIKKLISNTIKKIEIIKIE